MGESFQMREGDMEVGIMLRMLSWGNLGTEDGVGLEYTKMIILFILKVDSHISHCWVSKMLLC